MLRKYWLSFGAFFILAAGLLASWHYSRVLPTKDLPVEVNQSPAELVVKATATEPLLAQAQPAINLPKDSEFMVSGGSSTSTIRFIEGSIKPLDVHVGDKQDFRIVVTSPNGIKRVVAQIETDKGIHEVELTREGVVGILETYPNPYTVDQKTSQLKILTQDQLVQARAIEHQREVAQKNSHNANASTGQREVWVGSWIVKDTHDKVYHTNFVAYDSTNNSNSLVMTWSDLCAIPLTGNWNTGMAGVAGCAINNAVDGVSLGKATIGNSKNLNLGTGAKFVFDPDNSTGGVSFDGTSQLILAANRSSQLQEGLLYVPDQDGDRYSLESALSSQTTTAGTGRTIRSSILGTNDCNDTLDTVHPDNDIQHNSPIAGQTGVASYDYDCDNRITISLSSCKSRIFPYTSSSTESRFCRSGQTQSITYVGRGCGCDEDGGMPAGYVTPYTNDCQEGEITRINNNLSSGYQNLSIQWPWSISSARADMCHCDTSCSGTFTGCCVDDVVVYPLVSSNVSLCGSTVYPGVMADHVNSDYSCNTGACTSITSGDDNDEVYVTGGSATLYCR